MSDLPSRIDEQLHAAHDALAHRGELPSLERLQESYAAFRDRFGPEALRRLDGEALLHAMHTHGNKESLVYWLEFKNDAEFPGPTFGSISGGSAHKFGLFRRKDSGQWVTGSPQNERSISEGEAVVIARKYRDELLVGRRYLKSCPPTLTTLVTCDSRMKLAKGHQQSLIWLGLTNTSAYRSPIS